jgi:5'-3' exonuclease
VQEDRIVQMDRKGKAIRNAKDVQQKFGVPPALIPDFLALVGDTADGYPGLEGIGKVGAARLVNKYGPIEKFPADVLGAERWEQALLFKRLATLRTDAPLFDNVDALEWRGPKEEFVAYAEQSGDARLLDRCRKAAAKLAA